MKKLHSIGFHWLIFLTLVLTSCGPEPEKQIDRYALVNRHTVVLTSVDSLNPLTVGNGSFAFTVDITGLQTYPDFYQNGIPLGTQSDWGWHSFPNPNNYSPGMVTREFRVGDRTVDYYHDYREEGNTRRARASAWLRENPQRVNLGMVGLKLYDRSGRVIGLQEIGNPRQELDLWNGEIHSHFSVEGIPVDVVTICHPDRDLVAVKINSDLLTQRRIGVELRIPAADPSWRGTLFWGEPGDHQSRIMEKDRYRTLIGHRQDGFASYTGLSSGDGEVLMMEDHRFLMIPDSSDASFSFCCEFSNSPEEMDPAPDFESVRDRCNTSWIDFWVTGGAVDFSSCEDQRAFELERRVILSRYLTRIQCAGPLPPQETGLTFNSWHGKFHMEMHWWHWVHFILWEKESLVSEQLAYYRRIRDEAEALAQMQGYRGIRWPKMTGPDGITSPSSVGNYLIWQQPHYIYFAELLYQVSGERREILSSYGDLVFETAEFMTSFVLFDSVNQRFILPPPLIPAQETFPAETTYNPTFELVYWFWGLATAIEWKKRMDQEIPAEWLEVRERFSVPAQRDSLYLFAENGPDSFENPRYLSDHPIVLGILGMLPSTAMVNRDLLTNTFNQVVQKWDWPSTWGWDYPMIAMCAAAIGKYQEAVDFLLLEQPKNRYLPNGHNYQDERLPVYLPGNGAVLTAVARMCTGDQFPKDGKWDVKWENLKDL